MDFTTRHDTRHEDIIRLFRETFTASEGATEGEAIAGLVTRMLATLGPDDLFVVCTLEGDALVGSVIFTRMSYPQDDRRVFILSPAAVLPDHQGKGVGQALITKGLSALRENGVEVALTYGDINFYEKVGFTQITSNIAQPPLPVAYPEGWLGQSLSEEALVPLKGASTCVEALNDPAYW